MAKKNLYEYAVLRHTKENGEVVTDEVVAPSTILATNETTARMAAVRAIPEADAEDLDVLDIRVRPF